MLQNAKVTAFAVSELLRENQQGVKLQPPPPLHTPRLGLTRLLVLQAQIKAGSNLYKLKIKIRQTFKIKIIKSLNHFTTI